MLSKDELLFGAAPHDIGKAVEIQELYQGGNKHESTGYRLMIGYGIPETLARFTKTHSNWEGEGIQAEDLVVALADKIWKGKRFDLLEERLSGKIASELNVDYWQVYVTLDKIISHIANGADNRLMMQNEL